MLQDSLRLVLLDSLGHHVEDIVHDGSSELEIEVRFDTLLRDSLCDSVSQGKEPISREIVDRLERHRLTPLSYDPRIDERASFLAIAREGGRYHEGRRAKLAIREPRIRHQDLYRQDQC